MDTNGDCSVFRVDDAMRTPSLPSFATQANQSSTRWHTSNSGRLTISESMRSTDWAKKNHGHSSSRAKPSCRPSTKQEHHRAPSANGATFKKTRAAPSSLCKRRQHQLSQTSSAAKDSTGNTRLEIINRSYTKADRTVGHVPCKTDIPNNWLLQTHVVITSTL